VRRDYGRLAIYVGEEQVWTTVVVSLITMPDTRLEDYQDCAKPERLAVT
jgi:hypothetical protein